MDMIRYQPPATNLTVPTSAGYGDNVTPGSGTGGEREHELWRRGLQVMLLTIKFYLWWMTMYAKSAPSKVNLLGASTKSDYLP